MYRVYTLLEDAQDYGSSRRPGEAFPCEGDGLQCGFVGERGTSMWVCRRACFRSDGACVGHSLYAWEVLAWLYCTHIRAAVTVQPLHSVVSQARATDSRAEMHGEVDAVPCALFRVQFVAHHSGTVCIVSHRASMHLAGLPSEHSYAVRSDA